MQGAGCITLDKDGGVAATMAGRICSFYYLQHATMDLFTNELHGDMDFKRLLLVLASSPEYDELPVSCCQCLLHRILNISLDSVNQGVFIAYPIERVCPCRLRFNMKIFQLPAEFHVHPAQLHLSARGNCATRQGV